MVDQDKAYSQVKDIIKNYSEDIDNYDERMTYKKLLLQKGNTIYEAYRLTNESYNRPVILHEDLGDTFYHSVYLKSKYLFNISVKMSDNLPENLKDRWEDRFKEREELINKKSKSYREIEEFICNKYGIEIKEEDKLNCRYDIILVLSSLNKAGRPSLPSYLKEQSVKNNRQKMKDKMTDKYEFIKESKKNLLTDDEYKVIESKLEGYDDLINKLSFFTIKATPNAAE